MKLKDPYKTSELSGVLTLTASHRWKIWQLHIQSPPANEKQNEISTILL